jgi:protein gp37
MPHKIEWCTHTANPITGCRHGCPWCYARRMARRLAANPSAPHYGAVAAACWGDPFAPALSLEALEAMRRELVRARRPRRVFLGSMSDVACAGNWAILAGRRLVATWPNALVQHMIAGTCAQLPEHVFQILTKAPMNLIDYWPRNVWLGVSCPDTATGRDNVAALHVSATDQPDPRIRWASVEPLIDPAFDPQVLLCLDWVVVGAETGPGAPRPGTPKAEAIADAGLRIVAWAERHRVPVFVKKNLRRLRPAAFWPQRLPPGGEHPCP